MAAQYSDDGIRVLEGLEVVRKRPRMYFGEVDAFDSSGLLAREAACMSLDSALSGHCTRLTITLRPGCEIELADNATNRLTWNDPPMVDCSKWTNKHPLFHLLTSLHACRDLKSLVRIGEKYCKHGIAITTALSAWFHAECIAGGKRWTHTFIAGKSQDDTAPEPCDAAPGMRLHFKLDRTLMPFPDWDVPAMQTWATKTMQEVPALVIDVVDQT